MLALTATAAAYQPGVPVQIPSRPGGAQATAPLVNTAWQWQYSQRSDGTSTVPSEPTHYIVEFRPEGALSAQADCNQVIGTYTTSGSALSIKLGPSTLVGCPPGSSANDFTRDLSSVTSYAMVGEQLTLGLGSSGGSMTFTPLQTADLVGPEWQVQAYNNGRQAVVSVMTGTTMTASFGADGSVTGSGGCNRFNGSYTRTGDTLSIGPLATTRIACAQPIMDQENAYLAALQASTTLELRASQLRLGDASGATQVLFGTEP